MGGAQLTPSNAPSGDRHHGNFAESELAKLLVGGAVALLVAGIVLTVVFLSVSPSPVYVPVLSFARLVWNNTTPNPSPFEVLGAKVVAVYLVENADLVGAPLGRASAVWLHPQCHGDAFGCDVQHGHHTVTTYVDLTQPSEDLNALYDSGWHAIYVGTYRYAVVQTCRASGLVPTWRWRVENMTETEAFRPETCLFMSSRLDEPLKVPRDVHVALTLSYSLEGLVGPTYASVANGTNVVRCVGGSSGSPCFALPSFALSVQDAVL